MRRSTWLFFMLCCATGIFFPEKAAETSLVQQPYMAPDRAEIAAALASHGPATSRVTLEGKTDGLPRFRSASYDAQLKTSAKDDEPRPQEKKAAGLIRALGEEFEIMRAFATSA